MEYVEWMVYAFGIFFIVRWLLLKAKSIGFLSRQRMNRHAAFKSTGREVDFRHRGWGHNIEKCGDKFAAWCSPPLETGDRIITELGIFDVIWTESAWNMSDMVFFACKRVR